MPYLRMLSGSSSGRAARADPAVAPRREYPFFNFVSATLRRGDQQKL
jgi:hypothetical protein